MSVGMLCRSYDGDAKWLDWTMPTILEHCKGYADYVVVGIEHECRRVQQICQKHGVRFAPDHEAASIPNGYINQQYTKMRADLFTDADNILFLDSDVIATADNAPELFWRDGKLQRLYSRWADVGDAKMWRMPTWRALGREPEYEFMRRLPCVYPRSTIKACREFMEQLHLKPLREYMKNCTTISEFNLLGAYAYVHERDKFTWVNPQDEHFEPIPFRQFWSWGNMEQQREDFKQ